MILFPLVISSQMINVSVYVYEKIIAEEHLLSCQFLLIVFLFFVVTLTLCDF